MLLKLCTQVINPRRYSRCLRTIAMSKLYKNASLFYCTFHCMYSLNSSSVHMRTVPSKNDDLLLGDLTHVNQTFLAFQVCICVLPYPMLSGNPWNIGICIFIAHRDSIQIIKIRTFSVLVSHCFCSISGLILLRALFMTVLVMCFMKLIVWRNSHSLVRLWMSSGISPLSYISFIIHYYISYKAFSISITLLVWSYCFVWIHLG